MTFVNMLVNVDIFSTAYNVC